MESFDIFYFNEEFRVLNKKESAFIFTIIVFIMYLSSRHIFIVSKRHVIYIMICELTNEILGILYCFLIQWSLISRLSWLNQLTMWSILKWLYTNNDRDAWYVCND